MRTDHYHYLVFLGCFLFIRYNCAIRFSYDCCGQRATIVYCDLSGIDRWHRLFKDCVDRLTKNNQYFGLVATCLCGDAGSKSHTFLSDPLVSGPIHGTNCSPINFGVMEKKSFNFDLWSPSRVYLEVHFLCLLVWQVF